MVIESNQWLCDKAVDRPKGHSVPGSALGLESVSCRSVLRQGSSESLSPGSIPLPTAFIDLYPQGDLEPLVTRITLGIVIIVYKFTALSL